MPNEIHKIIEKIEKFADSQGWTIKNIDIHNSFYDIDFEVSVDFKFKSNII